MRKFFLALLTTFAVAVSPAVAADALKDVNPAPVPGEQILMKAELPVQTGDARRGDVKLDESQTETMDFWFFLPSDESAKSDDGFPLMLFLHGAGERGDDPNVVKNHGPAKLCANPEIAKSWKFMTVSPQCKPNRFWSPLQLIELIDRVCESYPVDRSRIYVTGLSMGGFGTWSVASLAADKIAAIVPICGWYAPEKAATITMPVWAFHGDADPAVNINSGRAIVEAVKEAGNPEVIFTVYPGVNHDSWTRTYANPIIYDWLLSKRLPPTIESPKPVPGKQLAASAKLPAKAGNAFRGDDRLDPERKQVVKFWFFEPSDDSAKTEDGYPLLLFLHGGGECGDNLEVLKQYGPPKFCADPERSKTWKFFTVSPQCNQGVGWSAKQLLLLIDEVCKKYPIDRSRVYVTGLSMGGVGSWGCAALGEGKIAAVAPLCGHLSSPDAAATVKMPIWAFHGGDDPVVSLERDQACVDAVKANGNEDVKFTVYPGVGHNCWDMTYDNPELYDWFLSKSLPK